MLTNPTLNFFSKNAFFTIVKTFKQSKTTRLSTSFRLNALMPASLLFLSCLCLSLTSHALATWTGPSTMNAVAYNTASNWSPVGVPAASEAININTAVTITGAIPIGSGNAINILSSGTLIINTGVTVTTGDLSVTGASGTLINNGTLNAHNVTYGNTAGGIITNNGTMNINNLNAGNGTLAGTFTNNGNLNVVINIVAEEGTISNAAGATITTFGVTIQTGGAIVNSGSFTSTGATATAKIDINSGGTFTNQSGGNLIIDISTSSAYALDVAGTFTNGGAIFIGHNPYNTGSQGIINRNTGKFNNTGAITFQIDPGNCVVTDNHGASGSFSSAPVTIISGSACGMIVLPVKLISFGGNINNSCAVMLAWKTAEEINFSHFEIQQSANAVQFTTVAKIDSKHNPSGSNYQLAYVGIKEGINYYRLVMVDIDGRKEYSNVIQVNKTCTNTAVHIYPNPIADYTVISNLKAGTLLQIINQKGQIVIEKTVTGIHETINTRHLSNGVYILSAINKNTAEKIAFKIIKQ